VVDEDIELVGVSVHLDIGKLVDDRGLESDAELARSTPHCADADHDERAIVSLESEDCVESCHSQIIPEPVENQNPSGVLGDSRTCRRPGTSCEIPGLYCPSAPRLHTRRPSSVAPPAGTCMWPWIRRFGLAASHTRLTAFRCLFP